MAESAVMILNGRPTGSSVVTNTSCCPPAARRVESLAPAVALAPLRLVSGGALQGQGDFIGLDLDHRALVALVGLPGPHAQPADHNRSGALAEVSMTFPRRPRDQADAGTDP